MAYKNAAFLKVRQQVIDYLSQDNKILASELDKFINVDKEGLKYKTLFNDIHFERLKNSDRPSKEFIDILDHLDLFKPYMSYEENTFLFDFITQSNLLSKFNVLSVLENFYNGKIKDDLIKQNNQKIVKKLECAISFLSESLRSRPQVLYFLSHFINVDTFYTLSPVDENGQTDEHLYLMWKELLKRARVNFYRENKKQDMTVEDLTKVLRKAKLNKMATDLEVTVCNTLASCHLNACFKEFSTQKSWTPSGNVSINTEQRKGLQPVQHVINLANSYPKGVIVDGPTDSYIAVVPVDEPPPLVNRPVKAKELNILATLLNADPFELATKLKLSNVDLIRNRTKGFNSYPKSVLITKEVLRAWYEEFNAKASSHTLFYALIESNQLPGAIAFRNMVDQAEPTDSTDNDYRSYV
ncbi:unnamed protein product [Didymodactylos carnosus]|uniref:Uncharacterized protein n=1 Tax=Didymodactylos carnosus TaxID=1234261 RepID=A0A8S2F029_9BILA|nr:unnamed protein product [Didymodactylos carnosus]CAF4111936.1 unnamed protein product [Didymodactylos carnosus]